MKTRADKVIVIDRGAVGKPLPLMQAWVHSSQEIRIKMPYMLTKAYIKVGDAKSGTYHDSVEGVLHPVDNSYHFYLSPRLFQNAGNTAYKAFARDTAGYRVVLGEGVLRVFRGIIDDSADAYAESTENGYIKVGNSWYEVRIGTDDDGSPVFEVGGVAGEVSASLSGDVYAYNKRTGFFHKVTAVADEDGLVTLAIDDNGTIDGVDSFAKDPVTNFFYRIECETDNTGHSTLQVGDKQ